MTTAINYITVINSYTIFNAIISSIVFIEGLDFFLICTIVTIIILINYVVIIACLLVCYHFHLILL